MKLNIQLFAGSVSIGTITETTDIDTNQSTFTIPATMTTSGSTFNNDDAYMILQWRYSGENNWTTISKKTFGISANSSKTKSWTLSLTHEDDGTLTDVQFRVQWHITSSTSGTSSTKTYSPTTIPRASEIDNITDGTTSYYPTITWTPNSNTFKYKVEYTSQDKNVSVISALITPNSTNPYNYNSLPIEHTFFRYANDYSMTATATLYTYKSNDITNPIGSKTKTFNVNLASEIKPTLSISNLAEADETMQSLNWNIYVQNRSKLTFKITTGAYSMIADNVTTTITTNGQTFTKTDYGNETFTTNVLRTNGTNTISANAVDSRKRSATTNTTYNVVAYSNPTISTAQVERCDANGNITADGTYIKISYGASISSCSGNNTTHAVYKVGYRIQNTGDYTDVPLTTNANSYSASGILFTDGIKSASSSGTKVQISPDYTYEIQFYVEDAFTESTNVQVLDTGFDLMNFNASGKAMAIGKVSEAGANEELLEIALPTYATEKIETTKCFKIPYNSNNGYGLVDHSGNSIIKDWNNGTITVNATGGTLHIGHSDTNQINFMNSKSTINSSGVYVGTATKANKINSSSNVGSDSSSTNGWYKVVSGSMTGYGNQVITWLISENYPVNNNHATGYYGIYRLNVRGNNGSVAIWEADWLVRKGFALDDIRVVASGTNWTLYVNRVIGQYGRLSFIPLSSTNINGDEYNPTYYNSTTKEGSTPTATKASQDYNIVSLYDNSSGSNASITLSETSANFTYLEIFYRTNDNYRSSKKIYNADGKKVILDASVISGNYTYIKSAQYSISGTSISLESGLSGQARIGNNVATQWDKNSNRIYIEKVIGIR